MNVLPSANLIVVWKAIVQTSITTKLVNMAPSKLHEASKGHVGNRNSVYVRMKSNM